MSDRHYYMEHRHGQLKNISCPDLMPLRCGYIAEYWKYHGRKREEEPKTSKRLASDWLFLASKGGADHR